MKLKVARAIPSSLLHGCVRFCTRPQAALAIRALIYGGKHAPVLAAMFSRRKSPLDRCCRPKLLATRSEMVPFPEPGGPKITARNSFDISFNTEPAGQIYTRSIRSFSTQYICSIYPVTYLHFSSLKESESDFIFSRKVRDKKKRKELGEKREEEKKNANPPPTWCAVYGFFTERKKFLQSRVFLLLNEFISDLHPPVQEMVGVTSLSLQMNGREI